MVTVDSSVNAINLNIRWYIDNIRQGMRLKPYNTRLLSVILHVALRCFAYSMKEGETSDNALCQEMDLYILM